MEDHQLLSGSESNLTDSWTLLNGDAAEQINENEEIDETSDAESLEVLEIEKADSNQTDNGINKCEHHYEGDINESDGSQESEIPIFQIIATQKTRKYVHHPNPYINMWLSIMMVIAIAITLGLGMGHYLGTKRFAKASNIIQQLQCKNHMLEMEMGRLAAKHKACEKNLHETENIFNILINGSQNEFLQEDHAPPEDIPLKGSNVTNSSSKHNHCDKGGTASCQLAFANYNFNDAITIQGDKLIKNSYFSNSNLEAISKNIFSPQLHMSFVVLNNKLSSLRFLLKKWSQHVNDSKLKNIVEHGNKSDCKDRLHTAEHVIDSKLKNIVEHGNKSDCKDRLHTAELPRNISCKANCQINEDKSGNEIPNNVVSKFTSTSLHNNCYRSPKSVNKKHEDKFYLRAERKILSDKSSLFYVPFKYLKTYNLPNFLGIGNESMKFSFVRHRNKWGSSVNKFQDTFKGEYSNGGDYKIGSRSCKGKKFYEGKDLHSYFERQVLHNHKKRFIDVTNARILFQNDKTKRNNKNIQKTYSDRSNFKNTHVEKEKLSNKIKNRKQKNTFNEKQYNKKHHENRGKKNYNNAPYYKSLKVENQKLKHNYKYHPFVRKEHRQDKNDNSKFKHFKMKGNYHQSSSMPIKKYFQKEYKKNKNLHKIEHEVFSSKKAKDYKSNYFKEKSNFHDSGYSYKYNNYRDKKRFGKKIDVVKVEKDMSYLKKRKLNQMEFKSIKEFKY